MIRFLYCSLVVFFLGAIRVSAASDDIGVTRVVAEPSEMKITLRTERTPLLLFELAPYEKVPASDAVPIAQVRKSGLHKVSLPRFVGTHDRLYSGFVAVGGTDAIGERKFAEEGKKVSKYSDPYPKFSSKKGLQVQMVDDAIALGVKHAALNFNLSQMVSLKPQTNDFEWHFDNETYHFNRGYIEAYDQRIKTLTDAGMSVTLILLAYRSGDDAINHVVSHPNYDPACPQGLSAFNTANAEGLGWFTACIEFLADRYSSGAHGRVWNYIVGNEVNSHWTWSNMGHVPMEVFADDYLRTVRICQSAIRKYSASGRVFISLEHHWTIRAPAKENESFPAKPFVERMNQLSKQQGDFDWNIAFHPYPENLFECRTWKDKSALPTEDSPRITFKNIEVLPQYLRHAELLYHGKPRHVILSEQGFHSNPSPESEQMQAAAYCYAYYKIARIDGIDSFILHRHVDHGHEGGLRLGLWRRNESSASPAEASSKKPIYEVFKAADTPGWKEKFDFALPLIGIKRWEEVLPKN